MIKFFYKCATGLKADIKRHCDREKELEEKIAELETIPPNKRNQFTEVYIHTYRHLLYQLRVSKAEVVSKIGKAK